MVGEMASEMIDIEDLKKDGAEQAQAERAKLSLEDLVKLGDELKQSYIKIMALEKMLKEENEKAKEISDKKLPQALTDLKLKTFMLSSGEEFELLEVINASITDERRSAAHKWLRDNELGEIIKNNVTFSFGKGEDDDAKKIMDIARELNQNHELSFGEVEQKESVHASTLKSFVNQRIKENQPLPHDLFGVYIYQTVKIAKPKKKKT